MRYLYAYLFIFGLDVLPFSITGWRPAKHHKMKNTKVNAQGTITVQWIGFGN